MSFQPHWIMTQSIERKLAHLQSIYEDIGNRSISSFSYSLENILFAEALASCRIEGNRLTDEEAQQVWDSRGFEDVFERDDAQEFYNLIQAYSSCSSLVRQRLFTWTEEVILHFHEMIVRNVRQNFACPGEFRTIQNYVRNPVTGGIFIPPEPHYVRIMVLDVLDWMNGPAHEIPILASGILHFQFVTIHPFVDGNGRWSRLLTHAWLIQHGYDAHGLIALSPVLYQHRDAYFHVLWTCQQDENWNMTQWLEFYLDIFCQALESLERSI